MSLSRLCQIAIMSWAVCVTSTAVWAGCNCGVPPSPAAAIGAPASWGSSAPWSTSPPWGVPAPQAMSPGGYGGSAYGVPLMNPYGGMPGVNGPYWAPGGYEARVGSPTYYHDPTGGQYVVSGDPYYDHFGPGFHRSSLHGHYRYPYYNYRAPWYFPGRAVYNRNTNFPW